MGGCRSCGQAGDGRNQAHRQDPERARHGPIHPIMFADQSAVLSVVSTCFTVMTIAPVLSVTVTPASTRR